MNHGLNRDTTIFLNPDIAFGEGTLMLQKPEKSSDLKINTPFSQEETQENATTIAQQEASETAQQGFNNKEDIQEELNSGIYDKLNAEIRLIEESSIINAENIATDWKDFHVNNGLTILFIIIGIVSIRPLINIIGPTLESLLRWRGMPKIEENMPTVRDRNYIASMLVIPFCLIISRYGVYSPTFIYLIPLKFRTLGIIGVFLTYCLIRYITHIQFKNKNSHKDTYEIAHKSGYTFFIILNMFLMSSVFVLNLLGTSNAIIEKVIIYICAITYFIFIMRKGQILATFNNPLTTILYLCLLEIPPTGLLIASALFL